MHKKKLQKHIIHEIYNVLTCLVLHIVWQSMSMSHFWVQYAVLQHLKQLKQQTGVLTCVFIKHVVWRGLFKVLRQKWK